mmetsp:Transcript_8174/g.36995  ORF Transcript_8174/g.36995 Transcript_8174/m.36995 type:complete len:234 (-) Transcript_8174:877-1578(-)
MTSSATGWFDRGGGPRRAEASSPTNGSRVSFVGSFTGRVTLTIRIANGAGAGAGSARVGAFPSPSRAFSSSSPARAAALVPPVVRTYLNRLRCTTSTLGSLTMRRTSVADAPSHPSLSHLRSSVSGAKNPSSNDASSTSADPSAPELSGSSTERCRKVSCRTHASPHDSHVNVAATAVVKFLRVGHRVLCSGTTLFGSGASSRPSAYAAVTSSSNASRHSHKNSCASCCRLPA